MEELIEMLAKQDSGFSITRNNKVIHLTMEEATDCLFHNLDVMGHRAIMEACLINGKALTEEQVLTLREKVTVGILQMIEDKICQVVLELF